MEISMSKQMGSQWDLLLVLCSENVFMCSIEDKLDQDGKLPSYYRRYVDDTFTIMPDMGYTRGHLHERVDGHKQKSSIYKL